MSTATTHIETEKQRVPALRFNEFEGDWSKEKLGNKVVIKSGISPSSYELKETGRFPFFKVEELNNCAKYQVQSRFYAEEGKNLVPLGSIIFPKRGAAILNNKVRITEVDSFMDSNLMALMVDKENNTEFLFYFLLKEQLFKIADTSTIPQINNKHIEPYPCITPSLTEQQKIASFLSAVDEKIQQLTKKKALLEQYKKGVMQQLFSGQLRFKDQNGNEYPEWEEKKITELAKTSIGLVTSMTIHYVDNGVALIRNSDIKQNKVRKHKLINLAYAFAEENKNRQLLESDIVTVHTGDIGVSAVIDKELDGCQGFATLNTRINNQNDIAPEYLCWYFNSQKNIKYATAMSTGDGRSNYNLKDFNRAIIPVPVSEEQQKIAAYLSGIDTKIEAVNNQTTQTQTFKKGLLQKMFV